MSPILSKSGVPISKTVYNLCNSNVVTDPLSSNILFAITVNFFSGFDIIESKHSTLGSNYIFDILSSIIICLFITL